MLCCFVLCCFVLFCIVLCCVVLCCVVLCCLGIEEAWGESGDGHGMAIYIRHGIRSRISSTTRISSCVVLSHLVVVLSHVILVLSHVILVLSHVVVFVCDVVVLFDVVDSNWASDVALFFLMFFLRKACKTPTNPTTKSTKKHGRYPLPSEVRTYNPYETSHNHNHNHNQNYRYTRSERARAHTHTHTLHTHCTHIHTATQSSLL